MAHKLAFRFNRNNYSLNTMREHNETIKRALQTLLDNKSITYSHIYDPSRNSIKVIFPTEKEMDKTITHSEFFVTNNFEPKLSLSVKAKRTVLCTNLDPALLETYGKVEIKALLQEQDWKIREIYIMKSKKSFKIEMEEQKKALEFIKHPNTNIEGIRLTEANKELEIDPFIPQCWECGQLEPNHNSRTCMNPKICLKCGDPNHKFYACTIPKDFTAYTEANKAARYCATCKKKSDHTTLDHRFCPIKREILRERAQTARTKRLEEKTNHDKETELITRAINMSAQNWPTINANNQQHAKIVTLVTVALLDEAVNQGTFTTKLEEGCKKNGLPTIKYTLEPNTAKTFMNIMAGAAARENIIKSTFALPSPSKFSTPSKYYKDRTGGKRNLPLQEN